MRELVLTDDPVVLSFVETLLREAGMSFDVPDRNMSALHGAAGRLPQRVVVDDAECTRARRLLSDAGLSDWLVDEGNR